MPLVALLIPLALSQAPVTIKYMPPIGVDMRYKMSIDMKQSVPGMGAMDMTISMNMSIKALSRTGDVTTVQTQVSGTKVDIPASSPMAGMKDMLQKQMGSGNKTVTAKMDSHFHAVGPATMGGSPVPGTADLMRGISFPDHPVKVGDTWSTEMDFGKLMSAMPGAPAASGKIPIKLTLQSVKGGLATLAVSFKGTSAVANPMAAGTRGGAGQKINITMESKGTTVLDVKTGALVSAKSTADTVSVIAGMNMKQHMVQSITRG